MIRGRPRNLGAVEVRVLAPDIVRRGGSSSVQCGDQIRHWRTGVGRGGERQVAKSSVASDDCVGTELVDVLGGLSEMAPSQEQTCVHPQRAERPDLAIATSLGAEQSVQAAVDVGDDGEGNREVVAVGIESFGRGEGDDDDGCVTELVEVIAHGDHMFLTGQSSKVTVQHQYEWAAAMITGTPDLAGVIDEFEVGERVADAECHDALNPLLATAAALTTNWSRALRLGRPTMRSTSLPCTSHNTSVGMLITPSPDARPGFSSMLTRAKWTWSSAWWWAR